MAPYNSEATPCIAIRFEEEMTLPDNLGPILDRKEILKFVYFKSGLFFD